MQPHLTERKSDFSICSDLQVRSQSLLTSRLSWLEVRKRAIRYVLVTRRVVRLIKLSLPPSSEAPLSIFVSPLVLKSLLILMFSPEFSSLGVWWNNNWQITCLNTIFRGEIAVLKNIYFNYLSSRIAEQNFIIFLNFFSLLRCRTGTSKSGCLLLPCSRGTIKSNILSCPAGW